ncbi:hypothetical protein Tco_0213183 [Tanacetum coccineum]
MAPLTFVDTHNMVAYLSKSDASEGFDQILDFLNAKALIRRDLHLKDAKGVECLPNNEIFKELARMGYEKPPPKLTFYKASFAPQWGMISDIDADAEISLVDETQRLDDDLIFDTTADLGGEEVVVKPAETGVSAALDVEVSAAEPAVTTVSSLVTTDSVTITAAEPVSAAAKELTDNDMTMAEALAELKTSKPKVVTTVPILNSATTVTTTKPKAKGITIQEPSVT